MAQCATLGLDVGFAQGPNDSLLAWEAVQIYLSCPACSVGARGESSYRGQGSAHKGRIDCMRDSHEVTPAPSITRCYAGKRTEVERINVQTVEERGNGQV